MSHFVANDWYFGWGWILWLGFVFLMFSTMGNWGYTYRAYRKYDMQPRKEAFDILNERYARGELTSEQYADMKVQMSKSLN